MSLDFCSTASPPGISQMDSGPGMGWKREASPPPPLPRGRRAPVVTSPRRLVNRVPRLRLSPLLQSWVRYSRVPGAAAPQKPGGEAGADAGDPACSLSRRFIGKNANASFHFILLADCAGSNNWLLPTPVIAAALLTLCKRPATLQVYI